MTTIWQRAFRSLLILLCLFPTITRSITCLTAYDGYQPSNSSTLCVKCELKGHLDENGNCVYLVDPNFNTVDLINVGNITTTCEAIENTLYCQSDGYCQPSQFGKRCSECHESGFLYWSPDYRFVYCQCYYSKLDPKQGCIPSIFSGSLYTPQNVTIETTKISCDSFQSDIYGCFAPVDSSNHRYGDPNPPIPTSCCTDNYGPPPGALTPYFLNADQVPNTYETCLYIGGVDPNTFGQNNTFFSICNGHGTFNLTTRVCVCDKGWALGYIGDDLNGNELYGCIACAPFYGPDSYDSMDDPPYCAKIYTPDPLTGIPTECSGRGQYVDGACSCFGNSTIGYWNVTSVTGFGTTVQTCLSCQEGYTNFPYCI